MKKLLTFLFIIVLSLTLVACGKKDEPVKPNPVPPVVDPTPDPDPEPVELTKHLILDAEGNYGGTINKSKYGLGSPFNGKYDHEDTEYYLKNDYYNMTSTVERTIFPHFAPYQQTMADSSGIACAVMILNNDGEDVLNTYNEVNLVDTYERVNKATVFNSGTTSDGLVNMFKELGYTAEAKVFANNGSGQSENKILMSNMIWEYLNNSQYMLLRWQDGMDFGWHIVIGLDNNGTLDNGGDDTLILADPYDNLDHYQDGYQTTALSRLYRWWMNVHENGDYDHSFEYVLVNAKKPIEIEVAELDKKPVQVAPERHLILNKDGSFGGATNEKLYGSGPAANGASDVLTSTYHRFVDYYNMTSNETRTILTHYQPFEQTMSSSCGISAILTVLNYYGIDVSVYNEEWLCAKYCEVNDKSTIYNVGVGSGGLRKLVETFGFIGESASFSKSSFVDSNSKCFPTYDDFIKHISSKLAIGTPNPVCFRPHNGHWETIIGYDNMGTDYIYDDVLVLADSWDTWDHYQDGYNTFSATMFYRQWYNGSFGYNQQYVVFDNNLK